MKKILDGMKKTMVDVNPSNINWVNAILYEFKPTVFFHPILEQQYQPIIVEKKSQVERFAKFSNGTCVCTRTSPIT
jgi:hypothetical protein